jgi:hypothetical protein
VFEDFQQRLSININYYVEITLDLFFFSDAAFTLKTILLYDLRTITAVLRPFETIFGTV